MSRLEETIEEQEATNERLKATLVLRQEEAEIMTQILKVRDKELSAQGKALKEAVFQAECLKGDVEELKHQVRRVRTGVGGQSVCVFTSFALSLSEHLGHARLN